MADTIVVLNDGRVEQVGSPMDLYHQPNSKFVAEFIGSPAMNVVETAKLPPLNGLSPSTGAHYVGCRPEHFEIVAQGAGAFDAKVRVKERLGGENLLYLNVTDDLSIVARTDGDDETEVGSDIGLQIPPNRLHQFGSDGRVLS